MGGELPKIEDESSGTLNRRRLLQGAAAAGIGVAVWTVPSITSLGGTPAYAANCTAGYVNYALGSRNTACNCGNNPNKVVSYKELGTPCAGDGNTPPFEAYLANGPGGPPISDAGICPDGYKAGEDAGVTASPPANVFCETVVRLWQGGSCGNIFQEFTGPIVQGPGFYPLPDVLCQGGGDVFISVILRCSVEEECLPT